MVSKLLSKGFIYLDDVKIYINSTDQQQSVNSQASISDRSKSPLEQENILIALNDDCLRSVFRKLHLRSLCSVANVCVRFNELAKEIFKQRFKNKPIDFMDLILTYPISLEQMKTFLINFGSLVVKLNVRPYEINLNEFDDILRLLNQYCTNIKDLNMEDVTVNGKILAEVRPLLSRLEYLGIKYEHNYSFNDLISSCSQLEHLSINHLHLDERFPSDIAAPKMISLHASHFNYSNYLRPFLKVNTQLKTIHIRHDLYSNLISDAHSFIYENFPEIESFRMHIADTQYIGNSNIFIKLKHLSTLMLTFHAHQIVAPVMESILESNIKLKSLSMEDGSVDDHGVNCIAAMKSIETLAMVRISGFNQISLTSLLNRLPNLEILNIRECVHLDYFPDIIKKLISSAKRLKTVIASHFELGVVVELPKSIENDYREIAKVAKKCGDKPKPLNISVNIHVPDISKAHPTSKSIYIKNEWMNMELNIHL